MLTCQKIGAASGLWLCSSLFSGLLTLLTLLYAHNGWPFGQPTSFNCAIRVAHASMFSIAAAPDAEFDTNGPRAPELLPSDLMNGKGRPTERGRMPRLLHQSWKDRSPPLRFRDWADTWRRHHPNWSYVLWTDRDNLELVQRFYPQYLAAYAALPSEIYRADMARNCYLHRFGGVYADFDVESMRPLEALLDRPTIEATHSIAYTARMETSQDAGALSNSVPNAFMASSAPGHPFWLGPLDYIVEHLQEHLDQPEWLTGPVPLTKLSQAYTSTTEHQLVILPPTTVFPYSWDTASPFERCVCSARSPLLDTARCKAMYPSAFAITFWSVPRGAPTRDMKLSIPQGTFVEPVKASLVYLGLSV